LSVADLDSRLEEVASSAADLREKAHSAVTEHCRPLLIELESILRQTKASIVRTPRRPMSILCVPALMSDDFKPESDLLKWLDHSGSTLKGYEDVLRITLSIIACVARLDACGLAQGRLTIGTEAEPEKDDQA
jgi:hypothetical protein